MKHSKTRVNLVKSSKGIVKPNTYLGQRMFKMSMRQITSMYNKKGINELTPSPEEGD